MLLNIKVPLYIILSIIGVYYITRLVILVTKRKKDPFWDQPMGNYTFKELYNSLASQNYPVTTQGMEWSGKSAPQEDLLQLFMLYYPLFSAGLGADNGVDDGGWGYSVLASKLLGYGLIESYERPDPVSPKYMDTYYQTSELGHKFHAELDKLLTREAIERERKRKKNKKSKSD